MGCGCVNIHETSKGLGTIKYRELIDYHPVGGSLRLRDVAHGGSRETIVAQYLIGSGMRGKLEQAMARLGLDDPAGGRGILITGNYGSGKTHILSFLTALAGDALLAGQVKDHQIALQTKGIAGRFEVMALDLRREARPLREVVFGALQAQWQRREWPFDRPDPGNQDEDREMLYRLFDIWSAHEPDRGYLLAFDGLGEFLEAKKGGDLKMT